MLNKFIKYIWYWECKIQCKSPLLLSQMITPTIEKFVELYRLWDGLILMCNVFIYLTKKLSLKFAQNEGKGSTIIVLSLHRREPQRPSSQVGLGLTLEPFQVLGIISPWLGCSPRIFTVSLVQLCVWARSPAWGRTPVQTCLTHSWDPPHLRDNTAASAHWVHLCFGPHWPFKFRHLSLLSFFSAL